MFWRVTYSVNGNYRQGYTSDRLGQVKCRNTITNQDHTDRGNVQHSRYYFSIYLEEISGY